MRATCSLLSPNNWVITHLLLVLSWGSLSAERIIPHIMSPDPRPVPLITLLTHMTLQQFLKHQTFN